MMLPTEGSRVRLKNELPEDGVPAGSLGTVTGVYLGDETKVFVHPDCRPNLALLFFEHEIDGELEAVS